MPRAANRGVGKVAISLPADLLAEVERLRRSTGESRSGIVRRSIELLLRRNELEGMVRDYVGGYLAHPEGKGEADAAMAAAGDTLAEEPWE